ncbi:hypothetical protein [Streptomyces sp. NPDC101249]|uniref:hypothetical protein n=1 Tax=Streptomyces sp. NPDC101249 TaxID=3366140 RepID=UPI003807A8A9
MPGGERHWNDDTQRWEAGPPAAPGPAASVPAPPPGWAPATGPSGPGHPADAPTVVTPAAPDTSPQWHDDSGGWLPPVAPDAPPAAPGAGVDRRLVWSVVIGAAVAGVAVSLVLTLVGGDGGSGDEGGAPAPTASAPLSGSSPGSADPPPQGSPAVPSPPPAGSGPPAGFTLRDDQEGFRIAVPEEWTRSSVPSQYGMAVVSYRSPDRTQRLQIFQVAEESPAASFQLFLSDDTPRPAGFREVSLRTVDDGGVTGSRLEYLASRIRDEPDVGTWRVLDERFTAPDGRVYAIASYGPDTDGRADELRYLIAALEWFCPPGTGCASVTAAD